MKIPTLEEADNLHKKYAPSKDALESVWKHCQIVRRIALQVADNWHPTNTELVSIGALLHDIGVYRLYHSGVIDEKNYITHGLLGYELLKEEGYDEVICRFALLHTGVGVTKEDIENNKLPLPPRDYVPETDEEKIVAFADKFHSKSEPPTFNSVAWYTEHLSKKFGQHKVELFNEMLDEFGEPDLKPLMSRYGQPVR
jgi:uncharacterized protein